VTDLRGALATQFQPPFDHARTKLGHIPNAAETIRWNGVWKWTLEYACASEPHPDAFAFLVPDPARPKICISIPDATVSGMDLRKLAKGVREVLAAAPAVDGVRWATWDLVSKSGVDEISGFILAYRTAMGLPAEAPVPPSPKAKDEKAKPAPKASRSDASGTAASNHKAGQNGTRRARKA